MRTEMPSAVHQPRHGRRAPPAVQWLLGHGQPRGSVELHSPQHQRHAALWEHQIEEVEVVHHHLLVSHRGAGRAGLQDHVPAHLGNIRRVDRDGVQEAGDRWWTEYGWKRHSRSPEETKFMNRQLSIYDRGIVHQCAFWILRSLIRK